MSDINWKRHGPMTSKPSATRGGHGGPARRRAAVLERRVLPARPSAEQLAIMELANRETERMRTRFGMSRRNFVGPRRPPRSASGRSTPCAWASWGNYGWAHNTADDRRL